MIPNDQSQKWKGIQDVDGKPVGIVGSGVLSLIRCLSVSTLQHAHKLILLFMLYIVYIKPLVTLLPFEE